MADDSTNLEWPIPSEALRAAALFRKALHTVLGLGGTTIVSFAFAVAVARVLAPSDRGHLALLQALSGLAAVAGNLAVAWAIVFHVGKNRVAASDATGSALVLATLSGVAIAVLILPAGLALRDRLLPGLSAPLIALGVLLATPVLIRDYMGGVLVALGRPLSLVALNTAQPAIGLAALGIAGLFPADGLRRVTTSWTVGVVGSALVAILLALLAARARPRVDSAATRSLARFGGRTYPALMVRFLNLRLDQFLVSLLASASTLGHYAVAVTVAELLIRIPNTMLWALSGAMSSEGHRESARLVTRLCRLSLLVLLGATCAIAVLTPFAFPFVFGARYEPAVPAVILLLPGMVCYGPAIIISEYFIVQRGRPSTAALIGLASMIVNITFNLVLTPPLGAAGASIASSLSYAAMLAMAVWLFRIDTHHSPREVILPSREDLHALLHARLTQERSQTAAHGELQSSTPEPSS